MGKPFNTELDALPSTYSWALSQPIEHLARAVGRLQAFPLLAVGSGGSFTACHFAAHLHGRLANQPANAVTPLQSVANRTPTANLGVLIPTAGGNNPDVVAAVRLLAEQEPQQLVVLCGRAESRVGDLAKRYALIDFIPYELPTGKDGFLATNSLLAFCVLLLRAYSEVTGQRNVLPKHYRSLLKGNGAVTAGTSAGYKQYREILERQTLLVLHGPTTLSAAIDIESKFTEAALGNVQLADYRQFAHGRHHWLAKRAADTAVLSLESLDDETVASQTLRLLPSSVPVKRLHIARSDATADFAAICHGFYLVAAAGQFRGIDPGRPGVPSFGRKLYHANAFRKREPMSNVPSWQVRAIERKSSERLDRLASESRLSFWTKSLDAALNQLTKVRIGALVIDYDGTLCAEDQRFDPLPAEIVRALTRLLEAGLTLGVATGRGKSVRQRLREAIPDKLWAQIVVGYYNGSQIIPLNSDSLPNASEAVGEELAPVVTAIKADRLLTQCNVTLRPSQITLEAKNNLSLEALWEHAEAIANRTASRTVRVIRSGHSVDIVPVSVSKLAVVAQVQQQLGNNDSLAVLRIGDRGRWPGNDSELLASPHGLSVHEVSSDPCSGWNLAPPGKRGWQATLWYLACLKTSKGGCRVKFPTPVRG